MKHRKDDKYLRKLEEELRSEERSPATIEKYLRDARGFLDFVKGKEEKKAEKARSSKDICCSEIAIENKERLACRDSVDSAGNDQKTQRKKKINKETVVAYKQYLLEQGYKSSSINSKLAGIRMLLKAVGKDDIDVKNMKIQNSPYVNEDRMLTRREYERLVGCCSGYGKAGRSNTGKAGATHGKNKKSAGKKKDKKGAEDRDTNSKYKYHNAREQSDEKTKLIIETICSTGIRVSELKHFTVEAINEGEITIRLKGKERTILIPGKLKHKLMSYSKKHEITHGSIFLNGKGKPIHRSQVWQMMKRLCKRAGVKESKVFPHNLRKLFARVFYEIKKDISKLADILGHSSINTTRIYIATSKTEHIRIMEKLHLVT